MEPNSALLLGATAFFLTVWAFIGWLKVREHLHALQNPHQDHGHSHVIHVRKIRPRRQQKAVGKDLAKS